MLAEHQKLADSKAALAREAADKAARAEELARVAVERNKQAADEAEAKRAEFRRMARQADQAAKAAEAEASLPWTPQKIPHAARPPPVQPPPPPPPVSPPPAHGGGTALEAALDRKCHELLIDESQIRSIQLAQAIDKKGLVDPNQPSRGKLSPDAPDPAPSLPAELEPLRRATLRLTVVEADGLPIKNQTAAPFTEASSDPFCAACLGQTSLGPDATTGSSLQMEPPFWCAAAARVPDRRREPPCPRPDPHAGRAGNVAPTRFPGRPAILSPRDAHIPGAARAPTVLPGARASSRPSSRRRGRRRRSSCRC